MRVLWLSRYMPLPPNAGDANYTRLLLRALAQAGAEVTFMALTSSERDPDAYRRACPGVTWQPIDDTPRGLLPALLSWLPLQTARFATDQYKLTLRAALARGHYHCVVLDYYALAWAMDVIKDERLIYVSHNFETASNAAIARQFRGNVVKKMLLHINGWKIARIERRVTRAVDLVTTNTDEDARLYQRLAPRRPPLTLTPGFAGYRRQARTLDHTVPRRVVILGSFEWIAKQINLDRFLQAADAVFARANIELQIVGSVDQDLRDRWRGHLRATQFVGFVDDLEACFDQARLGLVIEETGGGFKHKTLNYLFGRLPVAALAAGLGGLDDDIKRHVLITDQLPSLVTAIVAIIDDFDRLNQMQEGGFAVVQDRFNWDTNGQRLYCHLEAILA